MSLLDSGEIDTDASEFLAFEQHANGACRATNARGNKTGFQPGADERADLVWICLRVLWRRGRLERHESSAAARSNCELVRGHSAQRVQGVKPDLREERDKAFHGPGRLLDSAY